MHENTATAADDEKIYNFLRGKIEDYLRFVTLAGETRFPIFACESLPKLGHFVNRMSPMLTLTMYIV